MFDDLGGFPVTRRWPPKRAGVIQLYTLNTPNGFKASIMLEECGLAQDAHRIGEEASDGGLARARGRLDDGRPARVQRRFEVGQGGGERQAGAEAAEGGGEGGGDGDGIDGGGHRDPLCPPPPRCPGAVPLTRL